MRKNEFSKIKVKFISRGNTVKVRRIRDGHVPEVTEFNFAVVDFGNLFDDFKNMTLPVSKRRKKSTKKLRILAYEFADAVTPALKTITRLANLPRTKTLMRGLPNQPHKNKQSFILANARMKQSLFLAGARNNKNRFSYQKALSEIYRIMAQESLKEGINETLGFLLERGALLIGTFYHYSRDNIGRIVAKRLDYESGEFGLGLSNLALPKNISRFKKLHFQEDCIATGDSIGGTVLALKEKGIFFGEVQIDTAVATQTGVEFLQEYLKYLGIKRVIIKTGGLCFRMDDHFYLRRTQEEGYRKDEYFVGDMGEWSRILPKSYDKVAWWNKKRLDYC